MKKLFNRLKKGSTLIITIIMIFLAGSLTAMTLSLVLSSVHKNNIYNSGFETKVALKNKAYQIYDFVINQEYKVYNENHVYYTYNLTEGDDTDLRKSVNIIYSEDVGSEYYYFALSYDDFKNYESMQRSGIKVVITISSLDIYFMRYY